MLEKIKDVLDTVSGLTGKVIYGAWPEDEAPDMPYACFEEIDTDNFFADGITYYRVSRIEVQLYATRRSLVLEARVECAFSLAGLAWNKTTEYDFDNKCYETIYSIGG